MREAFFSRQNWKNEASCATFSYTLCVSEVCQTSASHLRGVVKNPVLALNLVKQLAGFDDEHPSTILRSTGRFAHLAVHHVARRNVSRIWEITQLTDSNDE